MSCNAPPPDGGLPDNPYTDLPEFNYSETPAGKAGGTLVLPSHLPLHACMGLNSCKGSDRYGVTGPNGDDPNKCAGQGYCATSVAHTCHTKNDCRNQGGCGLYGDAKDLANPGNNACRSMGSCATPINAERFSTSGENKDRSVWSRARQVFQDDWALRRNEAIGAIARQQAAGLLPEDFELPPETLSPAPDPFADTGPAYRWVSDNNTERGNMTACGASGMSGAGGCG